MYRRLFFLFPNKEDAQKAVQNLMSIKISLRQMHVLSKPGANLEGLPAPSPNQRRDMHTKIEDTLWNLNLGIFFTALIIFVASFINANFILCAIAFLVMAATYWTGYYYLTKPTIHLSGFHAAFEHNEILLMVDIPKNQISTVERVVHNKCPSASEEGISWTPSDLSMNV